jgi:hypothetical protein
MPSKNKEQSLEFITPQIIVVKRMRNYSKYEYFKKKKADAKAFLKAHPLPDRITKRKKA